MGKISYNLLQQTKFVNILIRLCHYFFCTNYQLNLNRFQDRVYLSEFLFFKILQFSFSFFTIQLTYDNPHQIISIKV
jgi:hypothetical protein